MFDDLSKHPDKVFNNTSAAAGAYQFMPKTWSRVSDHLGLKDFSPQSQELAGEQLAKWRGVDTGKTYTTRAGFVQDMYKMAPEWASIPTSKGKSYYDGIGGNTAKPMEDLISFYESQVGYKLK
jgi:lysozyme